MFLYYTNMSMTFSTALFILWLDDKKWEFLARNANILQTNAKFLGERQTLVSKLKVLLGEGECFARECIIF